MAMLLLLVKDSTAMTTALLIAVASILLAHATLAGPAHKGLAQLPPLLEFANGTAVETLQQLSDRKAEIKQLLQQYYYGTFPESTPPLCHVRTVSEHKYRGVTEYWQELSFDTSRDTSIDRRDRHAAGLPPCSSPDKTANFTIDLIVPDSCTADSKCPLFMTQSNHRRWAIAGVARGYVGLVYPGADSDDQTDVFRLAYPKATWGLIARRAWLGMRALDYGITFPSVDSSKVAVTGHSRNGKQSLIFAAWDERITAVTDSSSGAPAMTPYRLSSSFTFSESPYGPWPNAPAGCNCSCTRNEDSRPKDPRCCWWLPSVADFDGHENEVPIDSHGLLALIAPRHLASQTAWTDPCDPSFAVEKAYEEGLKVYSFLKAPSNIKLIYRPGQHHGFENIQLYFDFFDTAFGRGEMTLDDFQLQPLHNFSWVEWNASRSVPQPPPPSADPGTRVRWALGDAPALAWSPGGQYGLLDYAYIEQMLAEGTDLYEEGSDGIVRMAVNFGEYVHGNFYYSKKLADENKTLPAAVWLHPLSYQGGYIENYPRADTPMYKALAHAGYLVLTFDQAGFGQRILEKRNFYRRAENRDWSLLGQLVADVSSAVDVLTANKTGPFPDGLPVNLSYHGKWYPDVNKDKIFVVGYNVGGMTALLSAAQDHRIAGAVAIDSISPLRNTTLELNTGYHRTLYEWHALLPRLGLYCYPDSPYPSSAFPFEWSDVFELIQPRPVHVHVATQDRTVNTDAALALLAASQQKYPSLTVTTDNNTSKLDNDAASDTIKWLASVSQSVQSAQIKAQN